MALRKMPGRLATGDRIGSRWCGALLSVRPGAVGRGKIGETEEITGGVPESIRRSTRMPRWCGSPSPARPFARHERDAVPTVGRL